MKQSLREYVLNSNEEKRRKYAISILKQLADPKEWEELLAFAVVEMAINDIGKEPKLDNKGDIVDVIDSRMEWCNNPSRLKFWIDVLGIEWEFIVRMFEQFKLLDGINPKTGKKWRIAA